MIYNPSKPILNKESFIISKDSIEQLYTLNQEILHSHFSNREILNSNYKNLFKSLYEDDLCTKDDKIKLGLIPFDCKTFLSSSPAHVI